jgi:hypothetical protein
MVEGWHNDDYLVILSQSERGAATGQYKFEQFLPGYSLVGLRGWDDLIVCNQAGTTFALPAVPLQVSYLEPFSVPEAPSLQPDAPFSGKVKWYLKPLIFGGSAQDSANLAWVTHEQHATLVVWWNEQYKSIKAQSPDA